MSLTLVPLTREEANDYVRRFHRHSKPVGIHRFAVGVMNGTLRGVAIAGNPKARELDDGYTIEILRVCTDGTRNACSILYGACANAAKHMGYRLAITYTLVAENGASLRASGFKPVAEVKDRQWGCSSRPREERDLIGDKVRWERVLSEKPICPTTFAFS
jgi:hypothetical protein